MAYPPGDDLLDRVPGLLAAGVELAHLDTGQPLAEAGVAPVTARIVQAIAPLLGVLPRLVEPGWPQGSPFDAPSAAQ